MKSKGKSSAQRSAFPQMGFMEDGSKIKVDSHFKPYMATKVEEKKIDSGGFQVSLKIDESEKR